jgi:site-specific recombinase XerD
LSNGNGLSTDPRTAIKRRHHVEDSAVSRELVGAAKLARLEKRVTAHTLAPQFRDPFAARRRGIRSVQELFGHTDVRTAEICTQPGRCAAKLPARWTT